MLSSAMQEARSGRSSTREKHLLSTTVGGYDVLSQVTGSRTWMGGRDCRGRVVDLRRRHARLVSSYIGSWLDRILVVIGDTSTPFPPLLLAIVMAIVVSGGRSTRVGDWHLRRRHLVTLVYIPSTSG